MWQKDVKTHHKANLLQKQMLATDPANEGGVQGVRSNYVNSARNPCPAASSADTDVANSTTPYGLPKAQYLLVQETPT